jgi:hypothetical protein
VKRLVLRVGLGFSLNIWCPYWGWSMVVGSRISGADARWDSNSTATQAIKTTTKASMTFRSLAKDCIFGKRVDFDLGINVCPILFKVKQCLWFITVYMKRQ